MTVTLFGHRDTPENIKPTLKNTLSLLISGHDADLFYVGNNGSFDRMSADVLSDLSKQYPHIKFFIVSAYLNNKKTAFPDLTIYPEGLETTPRRYAIIKRNKWMINRSDTIVTYANNTITNFFRLMTYATTRGKTIINLATKKDYPSE